MVGKMLEEIFFSHLTPSTTPRLGGCLQSDGPSTGRYVWG